MSIQCLCTGKSPPGEHSGLGRAETMVAFCHQGVANCDFCCDDKASCGFCQSPKNGGQELRGSGHSPLPL